MILSYIILAMAVGWGSVLVFQPTGLVNSLGLYSATGLVSFVCFLAWFGSPNLPPPTAPPDLKGEQPGKDKVWPRQGHKKAADHVAAFFFE